MVECAARGDYDVYKFAFHQFADNAARASGNDVSGEREKLYAFLILNHGLHYVHASGKFTSGETPRRLHLQNKLVNRHFFCKIVIFHCNLV
jgi:hypothetical protein